jgi:hypothetical protein
MTRRPPPQSDSLVMLLDTMCNTFGGIILIALLIALLARDTRVTDTESRRRTETTAMLSRRLEQARRELAQTQALQAELERRANASDQADQLRRVDQRERLRRATAVLTEAFRTQEEQLVTGTATAQARMLERLRELETQVRQAEQEMLDQRSRGENLQGQLAELRRGLQTESNRLAQVRARQTQRLRLPREHATGRTHFYVLLRYGRIYPLYQYENGDLVRNTRTLRWQPEGEGVKRIEPIPSTGLNPQTEAAALENLFRQLPADRLYLVFEVYEDSFAEFGAAKELAVRRGLEYTWEPRKRDAVVRLGPSGTPPPPQ